MNAHLERIQHGYTSGVRRIVADVVKSFRRIPLSANQVTAVGFALNVLAAVLIYERVWVAAGAAFLLGSILDVFDGAIARSKGEDGPRGAFIDSTFDRIAEAAVLTAIAERNVASHSSSGPGAVFVALVGSTRNGTASTRKPLIPRFSQNPMIFSISSRTAGFAMFRSGWKS